MNASDSIRFYCNGCGACAAFGDVALRQNEKGYMYPVLENECQIELCSHTCMSAGEFWRNGEASVWGTTVEGPYYAHATDESVRRRASSGGVTTACAIFLLESGMVDGVIQTRCDSGSPIRTECVCSTTREQIMECCGSRYTISSPLAGIAGLLEPGKRYAYIGKPCDVMALRNVMNRDEQLNRQIPYLLSFMCAGMPSYPAGRRLLAKLNTEEDRCTRLTYRGNGWPGFAEAREGDRVTGSMTYQESWGKILGRDIANACRFCLDGIGEAADIACGDAWYIVNAQPDFSEHEGRNVVFPRTAKGKALLDSMMARGAITKDPCGDVCRELQIIQNYQFVRRTTMLEKERAMRLFRKPVPGYPAAGLRRLRKFAPIKSRARVLLGTLRRIQQGRI